VLALGGAYHFGPRTWARTGGLSDDFSGMSHSYSKQNPGQVGVLNRFPIALVYLTVNIDSGREIVHVVSEEAPKYAPGIAKETGK
jgi:hypothetical protein